MNKWWQEQKKIQIFTYLLGLTAVTLLLLLSWLFIRSHNIDMHQYTHMTRILQGLDRENSVFQKEVLSIQIHDNEDYNALYQSKQKTYALVKSLRKMDTRNLLSVHIQTYEQRLTTRNALSDQLLNSHAKMHITKQILALSGTEYINNMQKKVQEEHHAIMNTAKHNSMLLYISSMLLVFFIVIIFIQLRRTATRLQKTIMDLKFQKNALDQHAIVSITDAQGCIIYANDQFITTSQYSKGELIGANHNIVKSQYHSNTFYKELWDTISSGQTWQGDMCNQCKDGSLVWVRTTIVPFMGENEQPQRYISIRTDISHHKENEAELQQHRAQLEEQIRQRTLSLQQSVRKLKQEIQTRKAVEHKLRYSIETAEKSVRLKSEFIANMNHELRTPLNAIIGFSDLLREGLVGPLTETQIDYINDIFDSGNRLLHLISDIMDLSKIESGMVEFEPEPVIFDDVLQNSLGMIRNKAMQHNIQLHVEIDPSIEMVILDVRKVKQVLFNLLSNAVKFTADEGSIYVRANLQKQENKTTILNIAIQDTGIGISKEDLPKLFENFTQLDGSTDRQFEGTGLGLSLVKQLVELHQGTIEISSELGVGSCFTVKLPYKTEHDEAMQSTTF